MAKELLRRCQCFIQPPAALSFPLEERQPPQSHLYPPPFPGVLGQGDEWQVCAEVLMRGFLCGIACILPTSEASVSNFTFELTLHWALIRGIW